jgi:hypothetical protein
LLEKESQNRREEELRDRGPSNTRLYDLTSMITTFRF